jgi:hypothetical protein
MLRVMLTAAASHLSARIPCAGASTFDLVRDRGATNVQRDIQHDATAWPVRTSQRLADIPSASGTPNGALATTCRASGVARLLHASGFDLRVSPIRTATTAESTGLRPLPVKIKIGADHYILDSLLTAGTK